MSKTIRCALLVLVVAGLSGATGIVCAAPWVFETKLSAEQEVPTPDPGLITAARLRATFDEGLTQVRVRLVVRGGDNVVAAHFHCGLPGDAPAGNVVVGLFSPGPLSFDGEIARGVLTNADFTGNDCVPFIGRPVTNVASLALAMQEGLIYTNVHTSDNPSGEFRGQLREVDGAEGQNDDDEGNDR